MYEIEADKLLLHQKVKILIYTVRLLRNDVIHWKNQKPFLRVWTKQCDEPKYSNSYT